MSSHATIVGVHPVKADEPVHLIELFVEGDLNDFDIGDVTQEVAGQRRNNWQVPYDERVLEQSEECSRIAFFFHYLDLQKPLLTPSGLVLVPEPTAVPARLQDIQYEAP